MLKNLILLYSSVLTNMKIKDELDCFQGVLLWKQTCFHIEKTASRCLFQLCSKSITNNIFTECPEMRMYYTTFV